MVTVEICWSPAAGQTITHRLQMADGSTLGDALQHAAALELALPKGWQTAPVGIYGRHCPHSTVLRELDRIELHRALKADPKEARRLRAKKPQNTKSPPREGSRRA
jgi:putative ubiquitin-RnfH superfamily antitoxin RatB of RatAB toxin-antitoxin module